MNLYTFFAEIKIGFCISLIHNVLDSSASNQTYTAVKLTAELTATTLPTLSHNVTIGKNFTKYFNIFY